MNSAIC
jgi:hypothetical protein